MKALGSCLVWLALYGALAWGVRLVLERRMIEREPAIAGGLIGGLVLVVALGWLLQIFTKLRAIGGVRRGLDGEEPVDGEMYAAWGPIEPAGLEPLLSPITRTPCVAYTYRIALLKGKRVWHGVALGPCRIRSGDHVIRLLAMPKLDVTDAMRSGESCAKNAEAFVRGTSFTGENGRFFGEPKLPESILKNDSGAMRWDIGGPPPESLSGAILHERVVEPGDVVCAVGRYSMARGGLVVDERAREYSIVLTKQKPASAASAVFGSIGNVVKAAIAVAIVAVALGALQTVVPLGLVEIERPDLRPSWLEVRIDDLLEARVRGELARAGVMPAIEMAPDRGLAVGDARGRVRSAKGEVEIVHAELRAVDDTLDVLFVDAGGRLAGAVKVTRQGELARALVLGDEVDFTAIPVATYQFAPSGENVLAGRVSFAAPGDGPAMRVRFRAAMPGE